VSSVAVLGYHKIGEPTPGGWETWYYVPTATLAAHLEELRTDGWEFIDLARLLAGLHDPATLPSRASLVTFDDGYRSLVSSALPVLRDARCPAVAFVPTDYVGRWNEFDADSHEPTEPICTWDELVALSRAGVSVQSHGRSHVAFSKLDAPRIRQELIDSKTTLDARLGTPVEAFAYPYGDPGRDADTTNRLLRGSGYRAAFLYGGGLVDVTAADPMRIPRLAMGPDTVLAELLRAEM
jgi:peptidoglycan/xylan/chitin deacetylase (PgdA/CDA1 family)